ncbi:Chromate reductase [Streptococcus canis]|uniref:Chromate reductase n=1 Tax=Streptococcus canis TaxID=1329 RepID=A0A3P5Y9X9_STRCB|nr:NAD(P)H-dependent oxidoreductase [Streptococcus canis]VDC42834.1 Chromate reductase [Streptococcus canis]
MAKGLVFILGSLRQGSNSPKVAAAVEVLFPEDMIVKEIPIADLPLYHLDLDEGDVPESYTRFCQAVKEQDYHSRISLQLTRSNENTIDMGSRPLGDGVLMANQTLLCPTLLGMSSVLVPITNCVKVWFS